MTTHSTPGHYHHSHHSTEAALATMLDLEGQLLQAHWREILQWSATHAAAPSTIVDLGAGTGTGTLELAHTFPEALVVAVDQPALML